MAFLHETFCWWTSSASFFLILTTCCLKKLHAFFTCAVDIVLNQRWAQSKLFDCTVTVKGYWLWLRSHNPSPNIVTVFWKIWTAVTVHSQYPWILFTVTVRFIDNFQCVNFKYLQEQRIILKKSFHFEWVTTYWN